MNRRTVLFRVLLCALITAVAAISAFLLKGTPESKVMTAEQPRFDWAALFTALSGLESQSGPLSDLFLGRTDNINIRFAAAVALLFNVLMVVVAIIVIAQTMPRDDPGVGR